MDPRWNIINSLEMKRKLIYNSIILGFQPFVFFFPKVWRNLSWQCWFTVKFTMNTFSFQWKWKHLPSLLRVETSVPCHDSQASREMMLKGKDITNPVFPKVCFVSLAPHQVSIKSFNNSRILWRYFSFPPKTCRKKTKNRSHSNPTKPINPKMKA